MAKKYYYANRDRYYSDVKVSDVVDNSDTTYRQFHSSRESAKLSAFRRGVHYNDYLRDPGQYVTLESGKLPGKRYKRR